MNKKLINRNIEYDERIKRNAQAWLVVIVFILLIVGGLLTSCRSIKTIEQINWIDSTVINYKDSTVWHIRDSVNIITQHVVVNDSMNLVIQFGQGGGTYNAKTGEATNGAGVQQTDTHHEQRDSTAYYRNRYEAAKKVLIDTQMELWDANYSLAKEKAVPKRNGYDRFCSWWFWITFILLLVKVAAWVMEKIPATAPYVMIVRKFIPFL